MKNKKGCILSILLGCFIIGVSIPLFMTNNRKIKAQTITDLSYSTWVLNNTLNNIENMASGYEKTYNINFVTNLVNYTTLSFLYDYGSDTGDGTIRNQGLLYGSYKVYNSRYNTWDDNNYKTIEIIGGTDATNSTLISWLENNATMTAYNPPTTPGTQITHKYWSPYGAIQMQNNQRIGDENIQYKVLYNEYTDNYDETTQTGLIFTGVLTEQDPAWSYIESINGPGINILYHGTTNIINNAMWLEFTYGDYMEDDLYDFMDLNGLWFDDADPYLVGMNQGYAEGTIHGRALGQADGAEYTGLITGIFNGLGGLLSIQVFPNITIGLLIGLPLLLGALIIILKILRG